MSRPLLQVDQLQLQRGKRTLCKQLNWQVEQGQCWGILGQNGTGKTTLLHSLAGLLPVRQGNIRLNDKSLKSYSPQQRAQQIGLLLQHHEDSFPGSVLETALIGRHPHLSRWQWEGAEDIRLASQALLDVDLEGLQHREVDSLSGGERRRLGIATLLTQAPRIYLLDEPVNHLDPHHQHRILQHLTQLSRHHNKTVIMVLHDINLVHQYCDHVLLWFDDEEQQAGKSEDLLGEVNLSRLYHHPFAHLRSDRGDCFIPLP